MTKRALGVFAALVVAAAIFAGFRYADKPAQKDQVILGLVQEALATYHFSPKQLNDELSEAALKEYLNKLDGNRLFFTADEVKKLNKYKNQLDDQFKSGNSEFFDLSYQMLQTSMSRSQKTYKSLLEKPFDFNVSESTETNNDDLAFAKDEADLQNYWRKFLKWRVANRIYNKERSQDGADQPDELVQDIDAEIVPIKEKEEEKKEIKTFAEMEAEARKDELELMDEWFTSLKEMERIEWLAVYINSFTQVFDPHTEYFAPQNQEDFETQMSGQFEGIGAQLRKTEDYIVVERIITGSASWKQGELAEGDKLLQVAQGEETPVDIVGWRIDKAVKLIRGKKGTEVRLTVLKKDGSRQVIPIIRDVVELEATFARSAILSEDKSVGYIRLPKFYVDFYKSTNHNCAEDVKNEILKLKEEGVTGLIFDLRNNGGGSLEAAIEIVGLFIEKGPVVQVKSSTRGTQVKQNKDSRVYWDGPLLVLVNDYSASASEIFAAAIQDYNRGVIMGTHATFGKGTVQNIIDLDRAVSGAQDGLKPLGAIKITTEKFYRINGGTTQLQGVMPDIVWPDPLEFIKTGEKEYEFALKVDEIKPASYTKWTTGTDKFTTAIANSKTRIAANEKMSKNNAYAKYLKEQDDVKTIPLKYADFKAMQDQNDDMAKKFKNLNRSEDSLAVRPLASQIVDFKTDAGKKEDYSRWFKGLAWDIHLKEAVTVVRELN